MDYSDVFAEMYHMTLEEEKRQFNLGDRLVRSSIDLLRSKYPEVNPNWEQDGNDVVDTLDFDSPALRCAYMHKYAACNTGIVHEELMNAMETNDVVEVSLRCRKQLKLCCLGGGPGTDVFGVLAAICERFGSMPCKTITIVDRCRGWETTFRNVLQVLESKFVYGLCLPAITQSDNFACRYVVSDLLHGIDNQVRHAVFGADLVTMVKFVSATASRDTRLMVKRVFIRMKPGGMLLFVDTAKGGFYQMMEEEAMECGMQAVYGPYLNHHYENEKFSIKRFDRFSKWRDQVAIGIWKKPGLTYGNLDESIRPIARRLITGEDERLRGILLPSVESPPHSRRLAQALALAEMRSIISGIEAANLLGDIGNQYGGNEEADNQPEEADNQNEEADNEPEEGDDQNEEADNPPEEESLEDRLRWPVVGIVCGVFWLLIFYSNKPIGLSIFAWVLFRFVIDKYQKHDIENYFYG